MRVVRRDDAHRAELRVAVRNTLKILETSIAAKPWITVDHAEMELLRAVEQYQQKKRYDHDFAAATRIGFDDFNEIASASSGLAEILSRQGPNALFSLGIPDGASIVGRLNEIADAAARANLTTIDAGDLAGKPSHRVADDDAVTLAGNAVSIFHGLTLAPAGLTKATREGQASRTGKAFEFVLAILAVAGVPGSGVTYFEKAIDRARAFARLADKAEK